jgi:hypothetical protein
MIKSGYPWGNKITFLSFATNNNQVLNLIITGFLKNTTISNNKSLINGGVNRKIVTKRGFT